MAFINPNYYEYQQRLAARSRARNRPIYEEGLGQFQGQGMPGYPMDQRDGQDNWGYGPGPSDSEGAQPAAGWSTPSPGGPGSPGWGEVPPESRQSWYDKFGGGYVPSLRDGAPDQGTRYAAGPAQVDVAMPPPAPPGPGAAGWLPPTISPGWGGQTLGEALGAMPTDPTLFRGQQSQMLQRGNTLMPAMRQFVQNMQGQNVAEGLLSAPLSAAFAKAGSPMMNGQRMPPDLASMLVGGIGPPRGTQRGDAFIGGNELARLVDLLGGLSWGPQAGQSGPFGQRNQRPNYEQYMGQLGL